MNPSKRGLMLTLPSSRRLAVRLLAALALLGQGTWPALAGEEPVYVTVGQAHIRALEKWLAGQAVVESVPQPKTARLIFQAQATAAEPIAKGQAVRLSLKPPREGYVSGVVDRVDAAAGGLRVELQVENPGNSLVKGATYAAEVQVVKRANALVAPRAAIFFEGKQAFAFRLSRPSGRAQVEKVAVHAGYGTDEWVEVPAGLWPGQTLATSNLQLLHDGALVFASGGSR